MLHALPAALGKLPERVGKAGRGGHLAVFPAARVAVAFDVQRRQHFAAKFGGFFEHGLSGFQRCVLETGQRCDLVQCGQFRHGKQHVFHRGGVTHRASPFVFMSQTQCGSEQPSIRVRATVELYPIAAGRSFPCQKLPID